MKKMWVALAGVFVGFLNGLLGSGGGMVCVPLLKRLGVEERKSHATSILVIAALSLFSIAAYLNQNTFHLADAFVFMPGGILGALVGAVLLKKLPLKWIRLLFGIIVLYSAVRLFMK